MADDKMNTPESPENWDQYSSLLRGAPGKQLPDGFEGRLDARMKSSGGNRRRSAIVWRVIAPAFSIAAILMVVVLESLPESAPAPRPAVVPSASSAPQKRQVRRAPRPQRRVAEPSQPAATSLPRLVDTSTHPNLRSTEPATPSVRSRPSTGHGPEEPVVTGGGRRK